MEWTPDLIKKFEDLNNAGESIIEICEKLSLRPSQVLYKLEEIENEKLKNEKKEDEEIVEDNKNNISKFDKWEIREHSKKGIGLDIACFDCGQRKFYDKDEIREIIISPSTNRFLGRLFGRIVCENCNSPRLKFSNKMGKIIIDIRNFKTCKICGDAIIIPRLQIVPKADTCVLCADPNFDNSKLSQRLVPPIHKCPKCNQGTMLVRRHTDGTRIIFCERYSGNTNKADLEDYCDWFEEYYSKEDYDAQSKEYYAIVRKFRLKKAKELNVPPHILITDDEMMHIATARPTTMNQLLEKNYINNEFINKNSSDILSIFNKKNRG